MSECVFNLCSAYDIVLMIHIHVHVHVKCDNINGIPSTSVTKSLLMFCITNGSKYKCLTINYNKKLMTIPIICIII